jgi:hypothetical protein
MLYGACRDGVTWMIAAVLTAVVIVAMIVMSRSARVVDGTLAVAPHTVFPPASPPPPPPPTVRSEGAEVSSGGYRIPPPTWHRVPAKAPGWRGSHHYGYDAIDSAGGCAMFHGGSAAPSNAPYVQARPEPYPPLLACEHPRDDEGAARVLDMLPSIAWDRWAWAAAGGDPREFRAPEPWCSMTGGGRDAQDKPIPRTLDCAESQQFTITSTAYRPGDRRGAGDFGCVVLRPWG